MNASNLIPLAIFGEVVFGGLLNLTNVTGVIITAVEMENKNEACRGTFYTYYGCDTNMFGEFECGYKYW